MFTQLQFLKTLFLFLYSQLSLRNKTKCIFRLKEGAYFKYWRNKTLEGSNKAKVK